MRVSARCDYACKAILELALHWPNKKPLHIQVIAKRQKIPIRYLIQILIQLKRGGIVASSRGREGGYYLAAPPGSIRLGELMRLVGGPLLPAANAGPKNGSVFAEIWDEVEDSMAKVLDRVTFEDIANKSNGLKGTVIYQI
jgi:Rrf2 family transcriptional regulator, cysteine metabolism repressor